VKKASRAQAGDAAKSSLMWPYTITRRATCLANAPAPPVA
jgi:hypothetical protein